MTRADDVLFVPTKINFDGYFKEERFEFTTKTDSRG